MAYFGCSVCHRVYRVTGDVLEIRSLLLEHPQWKTGRPCLTEGCEGSTETLTRNQVLGVPEYEVVDSLDIHDYFRALCGFGTPDEIASEPEVVRALLRSEKIIDVAVRKYYGRTVIEHVDLENGLRLHLTLCSEGAAVYKITRYRDAEMDDDQGGIHQDPEDAGVQRDDRSERSGAKRDRSRRDAPLRSFLTYRFDGGDHQGRPQDSPGVSGGSSGDGAEDEEHEADPAGG